MCGKAWSLVCRPSLSLSWWCFLPPAADSPTALPWYPLFMPDVMPAACRSSNIPGCCRVGKDMWQSFIGNTASVFLPLVEISFVLDSIYGAHFPPKRETQSSQTRPGLLHPGRNFRQSNKWRGQYSCQTLDTAILLLHIANDYQHFLSKKIKRESLSEYFVTFIEHLLYAGSVISFSTVASSYYYPHFKEEEIEAQKGYITCPNPYK